jgi:predicted 3-demethylubiquinone-9 3-methyltransferase (glyoxalase superfamily)
MSAVQTHSLITPFLWFDAQAEQAADFYVSIFPNSRRLDKLESSFDTPSTPAGKVLTVAFELDGLKFTALNGGPHYKFTPAISFVVTCQNQAEIDAYWARLVEGGAESQCGWLTDKFGLSWQIVPANIADLLKPPKAMQAMLKMVKLDIAELERAAQS